MATILRVYREFMISGDKEWLSDIWPEVKRSMSFAWSESNPDRWDPDRSGLLTGCQHHTLDMELFGPNSWLSSLYLAALKAAAQLAVVMDEPDEAAAYEEVFARGQKRLNEELFNGEYFCQKIDLHDRSLLELAQGGVSMYSAGYWNEENGELKYQIGEGCSIDHVLGQWHADLLGLGNIFDPEKVNSALARIYRYNFITDMREHVNPCRIFAVNDEQGTMICSYPPGREKPLIPVPYCEETMCGFEYQAACHMILHGLEEEGLTCVKAVRDRYDGAKRNPWNEIECGSHYSRSLASYGLLLAYSGFVFDMHRKKIGFHPIHGEPWRFFWSLDSGFGTVEKRDGNIFLKVLYGSLKLRRFETEEDVCHMTLNGKNLSYRKEGQDIVFDDLLLLKKGDTLGAVTMLLRSAAP